MKIYILSTYEEHGAEEVHATLDPIKLFGILNKHFVEQGDVENERVAEVLRLEEAGSWGLSDGWGGVRLDIVEAE